MLSTYSAVGKQTSFCGQSPLQYNRRVEVVCRLEACVSLLRKNDILMNREFSLGF